MAKKITVEEFRKCYFSGRKSSSVYQSNKKAIVEQKYNTAVQAIRLFQSVMRNTFFGGIDIEIFIKIHGEPKGDGTNYLKAIEDALNKIAYNDDKQTKKGSFEFC